VQIVVERVIPAELIMEHLEPLARILCEVERERRLGAADRQCRLCAGDLQ
jgi:hypothetical protein